MRGWFRCCCWLRRFCLLRERGSRVNLPGRRRFLPFRRIAFDRAFFFLLPFLFLEERFYAAASEDSALPGAALDLLDCLVFRIPLLLILPVTNLTAKFLCAIGKSAPDNFLRHIFCLF